MPRRLLAAVVSLLALAALAAAPRRAIAHCDALDGPVVEAARKALQARAVDLVLPWVQRGDERELRAAFERTLEVRKLGPDAQKLADTWFFETLVRLHRAGEGAPFTGLKPSGGDVGPAIRAADAALEAGKVEPVAKLLEGAVHGGLEARFARVLETKRQATGDVAAGRRFVAAYVDYVHWVERVHEAAAASAEPVHPGAAVVPSAHDHR